MATLRRDATRGNRGAGDSGQTLVELALCPTVLLVLVFGITDFGRAIFYLEVITNLTGEGSSLSSRGTSLTNTVTAVMADASPLSMSTSGCVIATSVFNNGSSVKVSGQVSQCANG